MADEKATAKTKTAAKAKPAAKTETAAPGEKCCVEKCKQPMRAKGYCRKHYGAWRRGKIGKKQRYNTCGKEGCRKAAVAGGVCAEHKKGAVAEAAPATT